ARAPERQDELVDEARLADPRLALDEDDAPVARLRGVEDLPQLRELRAAAVQRGLARHAHAPQRTPRLAPDRRRALLPPGGLLALLEDPRALGGARRPSLAVLLEEPRHQLLEERRDLRVQLAAAARPLLDEPSHDDVDFVAVERVLAGGQLEEQEPERV